MIKKMQRGGSVHNTKLKENHVRFIDEYVMKSFMALAISDTDPTLERSSLAIMRQAMKTIVANM